MKSFFRCSLVWLCMFAGIARVAQAQTEEISYLKHNPNISRALLEASKRGGVYRVASAAADTLKLPFFDDFSVESIWPDQSRWTDSLAYISPGYGINPISFGCATLDGLNAQGNPYDNSNVNASGLCDELTSKPIDLFADENGLPFDVSDTILLVFYYQRKGRGDAPETNDSLRLEFYNVTSQSWDPIWKANGVAGGDTLFNKVRISIEDPAYRQNGFRFRFRNYGSQTGSLDIWNLDYIYLNKFLPSAYENIRDFTWVNEGFSLLNGYSAVPWKHYSQLPSGQQQSMIKTTAEITLRNNNEANAFPVKISGFLEDQYGNSTTIVGGGGLNNIQVPLNTNVMPPATINSFTFQDPTLGEDAPFEANYVIGLTSGVGFVDDFPINDTLRYRQNFSNYYAYDDGTAELSYGLNVTGGQIAYKFTTLQSDTLRAFKIFFAQLGLSVTSQLFRLAIWTGSSTPSGSPIYTLFNQTPNYIDSINGFYTYLTDPVYLTAGTYFFGIIQNGTTFLNLGLDINTPADQSKKLINTNGTWTNSQLPGMWMIRPVFSGMPIDVGVEELSGTATLQLYPVPARDQLHVKSENLKTNTPYVIHDITGRTVKQGLWDATPIDVSLLETGMFVIQFSEANGSERYGRFSVIR